jgi:hypothetical protein
MKKIYIQIIVLFIIAFITSKVSAQTAPYQLTKKWTAGYYLYIDFTSGTPVFNSTTNRSFAAENSTSITNPSGVLMFYSPGKELWSNGGATPVVASGNLGGTSSTQAAIAIPDPADATGTVYYLFTANDNTGGKVGAIGGRGINAFKVTVTGTGNANMTVSNLGNISADNTNDESIFVSSDGGTGYWLLSHAAGSANLNTWRITSAGIGAKNTVAVPSGVNGSTSNGALKINKCQNKIAMFTHGSPSTLEVFNWNKTTGTFGTLIQRITGLATNLAYGVEFSPDGNFVYVADLGGHLLKQVDLTTATVTTLSSASSNAGSNEIGGLMLGPDDKIYVTNGQWPVGPANIGVIANPNVSGVGCNYNGSALNTGGIGNGANGWPPFLYRGISNIAFINPRLLNNLTATATGVCNRYDINFSYRTYLGDNITLAAGSTIDYGDGSAVVTNPTFPLQYNFPTTGGPYKVKYTYTDAVCGETRVDSVSVIISCPAPVELLSFEGKYNNQGVDLTWATASETENDYFDVQRSLDGVNFETIKTVKGAGNSKSVLYYGATDTEVTKGKVYYRLVQHDYNGTLSYSKIVAVEIVNATEISVYPNPFHHDLNVVKSGDVEAVIYVYDVYGRLLEQKVSGEGETKVSVGEFLAIGSYIVKVTTANTIKTFHVEKK